MQIRLGFDIITRQRYPTPMVLMLHTRPEIGATMTQPDDLQLTPEIPMHTYIDAFGNKCTRLIAPVGSLRITTEALLDDDGAADEYAPDARQAPIEELPDECLQFLLGSRYCEVDKLTSFAWEQFGKTPMGWARVQAVTEWVHHHVTFGYAYASSTKNCL